MHQHHAALPACLWPGSSHQRLPHSIQLAAAPTPALPLAIARALPLLLPPLTRSRRRQRRQVSAVQRRQQLRRIQHRGAVAAARQVPPLIPLQPAASLCLPEWAGRHIHDAWLPLQLLDRRPPQRRLAQRPGRRLVLQSAPGLVQLDCQVSAVPVGTRLCERKGAGRAEGGGCCGEG